MAALVAAVLMATSVAVLGTVSPVAADGAGYVLAQTPVYNSYWRGSGVVWYTNYDALLSFDCWADSPYSPYERFMRLTGSTDFIRTAQIDPEPGGLPKCP